MIVQVQIPSSEKIKWRKEHAEAALGKPVHVRDFQGGEIEIGTVMYSHLFSTFGDDEASLELELEVDEEMAMQLTGINFWFVPQDEQISMDIDKSLEN